MIYLIYYAQINILAGGKYFQIYTRVWLIILVLWSFKIFNPVCDRHKIQYQF